MRVSVSLGQGANVDVRPFMFARSDSSAERRGLDLGQLGDVGGRAHRRGQNLGAVDQFGAGLGRLRGEFGQVDRLGGPDPAATMAAESWQDAPTANVPAGGSQGDSPVTWGGGPRVRAEAVITLI